MCSYLTFIELGHLRNTSRSTVKYIMGNMDMRDELLLGTTQMTKRLVMGSSAETDPKYDPFKESTGSSTQVDRPLEKRRHLDRLLLLTGEMNRKLTRMMTNWKKQLHSPILSFWETEAKRALNDHIQQLQDTQIITDNDLVQHCKNVVLQSSTLTLSVIPLVELETLKMKDEHNKDRTKNIYCSWVVPAINQSLRLANGKS